MNRETQTRIGWIIVALIIIGTGLRNLIAGKIFGKVVISTTRPVEGWFVHVLGLVLIVAGVCLLIRMIRRQ